MNVGMYISFSQLVSHTLADFAKHFLSLHLFNHLSTKHH